MPSMTPQIIALILIGGLSLFCILLGMQGIYLDPHERAKRHIEQGWRGSH